MPTNNLLFNIFSILSLFFLLSSPVFSQSTDASASANEQAIVVGDFNGISGSPPFSFSTQNSSKLISLDNSTTTNLNIETGENQQINAACTINFKNKDWNVVGGFFSSINGNAANNIFASTLQGEQLYFLSGLNGAVNTLYCDQENQIVWVGGNFTGPSSDFNSTNISSTSYWSGGLTGFDLDSSNWLRSSWNGLDGSVFALATNPSKTILWAGGNFNNTLDSQNDAVLDSQPVNLAAASIIGGNNYLFPSYADPLNAVCKGTSDDYTSPWLLRDLLPGYFQINFSYSLAPTLLRIKNTQLFGRGTQSIRVERASDKAALQMVYLDPATNLKKFCTNECYLIQNSTDWQEFEFDTKQEMSGIIINIVQWFGQGGGFAGVELYQRDPIVFGNPNLNFPSCYNKLFPSKVAANGTWTLLSLQGTSEQFVKSDVAQNQLTTGLFLPSLSAYPSLETDGFYDIYVDIPRCTIANDCDQRTDAIFQVATSPGPGGIYNATVSQKTDVNSSILLYSGFVTRSASNFRPYVKIDFATPPDNSTFDSSTLTLVFQSVRFIRKQSYSNLNGAFGIRLDRQSPIYSGPTYGTLQKSLPDGSIVTTITTAKNGIFIGGQFDQPSKNLAYYANNDLIPVPNGGIKGLVKSSAFYNDTLYVGGSFSGTADGTINSPNFISLSTNPDPTPQMKFKNINGLNGIVNTIAPYSPVEGSIIIGGYFSLATSNPNNAPNVALFDSLSGSFTYPPLLGGGVTTAFNNGTSTIISGPFTTVANLEVNGVARVLSGNSLESVSSYGSSLVPNSQGILRANAVIYQSTNGSNPLLVLGGEFSTTDGSTNIAYVAGDIITGIGPDIDSEVLSLASAGTLLFIGGIASQNAKSFNGFATYNMESKKFQNKPPPLKSIDQNTVVQVNSIAVRPNTSMVIVGGNFDKAGDINCKGVCVYDINEMRYSPLSTSTSLNGYVNSLFFYNNNLLIGGEFVNGSTTDYVLVYNFNTNTYSSLPSSATLSKRAGNNTAISFPGPIAQITQYQNSDIFFLGAKQDNNPQYIYSVNRNGTLASLPSLSSDSTVNSISVLPSGLYRSSTDSYVVSALGDLNLDSGQKASSAILTSGAWQEQLHAVRLDGSYGTLNAITLMQNPVNVIQRKRMRTIWVVLIAFAISLFLVFLIVLAGILYIYYKNRHEASYINSIARDGSNPSQMAPLLAPVRSDLESEPKASQMFVATGLLPQDSEKQYSVANMYANTQPLKSTDSLYDPQNARNFPAAALRTTTDSENARYDPNRKRASTASSISQEMMSSGPSYSNKSYLGGSSYPNETTLGFNGSGNPISKSPVSFFARNLSTTPDTRPQPKKSQEFFSSSTSGAQPQTMHNIPTNSFTPSVAYQTNNSNSNNIAPNQQQSPRNNSSTPIRDALKIYPMYYAKFTFNSREEGELGFNAGDRVFVIDKSDEIWWMGIVDRGPNIPLEQGLFPATYIDSKPPSPDQLDA